MRFSSIRARVLYLSGFYAIVLVGSVTTATYFFVADGMARAAEDAVWRFAAVAETAVEDLAADTERSVAAEGYSGREAELVATERTLERLPVRFSFGIVEESEFALYHRESAAGELRPVWSSRSQAADAYAEGRERALAGGAPVQSGPERRDLLTGMFTKADLGTHVVHVPIALPDGSDAVFDVVYRPLKEQAILDAVRAPMVAVAAFAALIAVLMMQVIMGWVLSLVERIRNTADAITAGQLDVHLPEEGEHEIAALVRSLNRLVDALRRRSEAQTRFVADASHELATPVAGIRGYVNILRAWGGEDPVVHEEALSAIDRESRRMARLCTDLLSIIRSDEALERRATAYDINAVARHVLAAAATRYVTKHLEIEGPDEDSLMAWGDPDRIEEALGTLVDNAFKYTPEGGSVRLMTMIAEDHVLAEISDTGIGIPPEDLPNVFERFYRSDESRSKDTGGFGLGLAIAKHIIDTNAGTIDVHSVLGDGTTFTISLPRPRGGALQ